LKGDGVEFLRGESAGELDYDLVVRAIDTSNISIEVYY
jgi:hypothetical protein